MSETEVRVAADQEDVPSWVDDLPDKFKSNPGAFIDSYKNLEARLTQTSQQLREQQEQFEAYLAEEPEVESPRERPDRGRQLANIQRMTEEASFRAARQVVDAISSNRVPAPEDPEMLAQVASQLMPTLDSAWSSTDPRLLAGVLEGRPDLLSDDRLGDMRSVANDLSTAAALARGLQSEQTLHAYRRAEDMRDAKRNAQTLSGTTGKGAPASDDEDFFDRLQVAHGKTWANSQSG